MSWGALNGPAPQTPVAAAKRIGLRSRLLSVRGPYDHIAGGGFFVTYSRLPLALAWEVFGPKCGVATLDELRDRLARLSSRDQVTPTTEIGCTVLANPFLLAQADWIPLGDSFQRQTVVGKFFDSAGDGASIWQQVSAYLAATRYEATDDRLVAIGAAEPHEKFGAPVLTKPRLGSPPSAFS
jgi:putative restriction endonuclease